MKYFILLMFLSANSLNAMNNNDPRPVRFASKEILYYRLDRNDKAHKTHYATLCAQHNLHSILGNSIQTRKDAGCVIMDTLQKSDPDMPEQKLIEHKRTIMNILRPELEIAKL